MTILSLIAATFTFTATATGVEKGAPIEFPFVGEGSDRDYESLFFLDRPVDEFCRALEAAGCPRGTPESVRKCILWPVGCQVKFTPALDEFMESRLADGLELAPPVYTGGLRLPDGRCDAATNMPLSAFCVYSLPQSPIVLDSHYDQGAVYNGHLVKKHLEKGTRVQFTLSWDASTLPAALQCVLRPGNSAEVLKELRNASSNGCVSARIDFDGNLTLAEAQAAATALSVVDSRRVRINGVKEGQLYFRAFLPMVKWRDRQERVLQPFELTLGATNALVHIDEDWTVDGPDPKLTPHEIRLDDVPKYPKTDTCFVFASSGTRLNAIYAYVRDPRMSHIRTWYVFDR